MINLNHYLKFNTNMIEYSMDSSISQQMKLFDSPTMRETIHRLLRSQMALKGVDYNGLSQRLSLLGVSQTATNLRSKINHGTLGAQLFIFIQFALNVDKLDIQVIREVFDDVDHDLKLQAVEDLSTAPSVGGETVTLQLSGHN